VYAWNFPERRFLQRRISIPLIQKRGGVLAGLPFVLFLYEQKKMEREAVKRCCETREEALVGEGVLS
jgi:hypothetical protein